MHHCSASTIFGFDRHIFQLSSSHSTNRNYTTGPLTLSASRAVSISSYLWVSLLTCNNVSIGLAAARKLIPEYAYYPIAPVSYTRCSSRHYCSALRLAKARMLLATTISDAPSGHLTIPTSASAPNLACVAETLQQCPARVNRRSIRSCNDWIKLQTVWHGHGELI